MSVIWVTVSANFTEVHAGQTEKSGRSTGRSALPQRTNPLCGSALRAEPEPPME
jgi:hypothetical protein